jgi:predicted SprT family Zn-dependent metalloprotease
MPLLRQLEFIFHTVAGIGDPGIFASFGKAGVTDPGYNNEASRHSDPERFAERSGYSELMLLQTARELLCAFGADRVAAELRVEWNSRLRTAAGRADYCQKLISLNPRLSEYPAEIDRTLRHELAHILAQFRAGRRRILAHGAEWRQACRDLGIGDEKRCHNLPFAVSERARRYLYKCPHCQRDFPRVRRIRRVVACLVCCRAHNGGQFDVRFRLKLVSA